MRSTSSWSGSRRGFTLVELVIVVAILGLLSATAIPQYQSFTYRARRAEVPALVDSLHTAQIAYFVANDRYLIIDAFTPRAAPDRQLADWPGSTEFTKFDWNPDGAVRGVYKISGDEETSFQIIGRADVDGDGDLSEYQASQLSPVERITPSTTY